MNLIHVTLFEVEVLLPMLIGFQDDILSGLDLMIAW
jgi:hypothetical protein